MPGIIGSSIKRREDPALITGRGKYTDDFKLPGMLHAAIVRSPHAHARIKSIDAKRGTRPPRRDRRLHRGGHREGRAARDAAGRLAAAQPQGGAPSDPRQGQGALRRRRRGGGGGRGPLPGAGRRRPGRGGVRAAGRGHRSREGGREGRAAPARRSAQATWRSTGRSAIASRTEEAFARAAHTAEIVLRNNRLIPHAIEPRSALADFDPDDGQADAAADHPEPARPSPADDARLDRPARAQDARDRARGGRRLRLEDRPLRRRGDRVVLLDAAAAAR